MQQVELTNDGSTRRQHRAHDPSDLRIALIDPFPNPGLELAGRDLADLETKRLQPGRFAKSKAVGAHFGLTPKKYQSGEIDRIGRISKVGDAMVRTALFEAANVMLTRTVRFSTLKAWALRVAGRHGAKKAKVALARKLAVVMHRMWVDGTTFRWGEASVSAA